MPGNYLTKSGEGIWWPLSLCQGKRVRAYRHKGGKGEGLKIFKIFLRNLWMVPFLLHKCSCQSAVRLSFLPFFNSWEKSLFTPTSLRNAAICAQQNWCNLLFDVPIGYYIYFLKKGEQKIVLVLYLMFNKYFDSSLTKQSN